MDRPLCKLCRKNLAAYKTIRANGFRPTCGSCRISPEKRQDYYKRFGKQREMQPDRRFKAGQRRAKLDGVIWTLTFEQYVYLLNMPCHYGGDFMKATTGVGLDQKIPGAGYTPKNSVPCCTRHNHIKGDSLSYDDMVFLMINRPGLRKCGAEYKVS